MVEENLTTDAQTDDAVAPPEPIAKMDPPESRFLFVDIAALRAKQLRRGARPRLASMAEGAPEVPADHPRKPERVAMEEVRQGLVMFDFPEPTPEPSGEQP